MGKLAGVILMFGCAGAFAQSETLPQQTLGNGATASRDLRIATVGRDEFDKPMGIDKPQLANRYFSQQRLPLGETSIDPRWYERAREQAEALPLYSLALGREISPAERSGTNAWTFLGPDNIGGRTRALQFRPGTPTTMYAGGVAGGFWRSTNTGATWAPLGDLLPNLAVTALAINATTPDTMYIGTGEGFFNVDAVRGNGILRSTDGGVTWTPMLNTVNQTNFRNVMDLVISPNDPLVLYAATNTGIMRTLDGAVTWSLVQDEAARRGCTDLLVVPSANPDTVLAACGQGVFGDATARIYRNTNANGAGVWANVNQPNELVGGVATNAGRISLAIAPSNHSIMYALASQDALGAFPNASLAVYRSSNGGATWTAQFVFSAAGASFQEFLLTNWESFQCFGNPFSSQGWYDNQIGVDPLDPARVWAVGIDAYRSDNSGVDWGVASFWPLAPSSALYAHADGHAIVFHPSFDGVGNRQLFIGSDGGVRNASDARGATHTNVGSCTVSNGMNWTDRNGGYGVTQFYHGKPYPSGTQYLAGAQDNGSNRNTTGLNWASVSGGDGAYVAVDPTDTQRIYTEFTNISIQRSDNGGTSFTAKTTGITTPSVCGQFINPFIMDPNFGATTPTTRRLFTSSNQIWRTANSGDSWVSASVVPTTDAALSCAGDQFNAIAAAPNTATGYVLGGTDDGYICRLDGAFASTNVTAMPCVLVRANAVVSSIAFDPNQTGAHNTRRAYATFSTFGGNKLFVSNDGGATWAALNGTGSGVLPDAPAHTVVVDPAFGLPTGVPTPEALSNRLYVGTDLGVFVSVNDGATWARENSSFANVPVEHMEIQTEAGTRRLYAFTHGRGAFRTEVRASAENCNNNPILIPDLSTVTRDVVINNDASNTATVIDLDVRVQLTHTFVGDIRLSLLHVASGSSVNLMVNPACSSANMDAYFDDDADQTAATLCTFSGASVLNGRFRPTVPLTSFNGLAYDGTWRLTVSDSVGGDSGSLNSVCITPTANRDATVPAIISELSSRADARGVTVDFETASNAGTVAFELSTGSQPVLVASAGDGSKAQRYRAQLPAGTARFTMSTVEADGKRASQGEFVVGARLGQSASSDLVAPDWRSARVSVAAAERAPQVSNVAELLVERDGLYQVRYEDLLAAGLNGFAKASVEALALTHQGQPVPVRVRAAGNIFAPGDLLEFYGTARARPSLAKPAGLYGPTSVYQLSLDNAQAVRPGILDAAPNARTSQRHARSLRTLEQNRVYSFSSPNGDPWAWERVVATTTLAEKSVTFDAPDVYGASDENGAAKIRVALWGGLDEPSNGQDHHARVYLNDVLLEDARFDGFNVHEISSTLEAGLLRANGNVLRIALPADTGGSADVVYLEDITLDYERVLSAENGQLRAELSVSECRECGLYVLSGFDAGASAWLLGSDGSAQVLQGSTYSAGLLSAQVREAGRLVAASSKGMLQPTVRAALSEGSFAAQIDYAVIAHDSLRNALAPLVAARTAQGLRVEVVSPEQLYARYSASEVDPQAFATYLDNAKDRGARFALLAGADSYDYWNDLSLGSVSLVPSAYVALGPIVRFTPSDASLGDLAIGRLPARTAAQLSVMVAKILQAPSGAASTQLVADRELAGVNFTEISDSIALTLPAPLAARAYLDGRTVEAARADLRAGLSGGARFVHYVGHASPTRWTREALVTASQIANGEMDAAAPFTALAWGCWSAYHVDPASLGVGQAWLERAGGASAIIGASTLTEVSHEQELARLLAPKLAGNTTLGEALQQAKAELSLAHPDWLDVRLGVQLLGDPAQRAR